MIRRVIFVLAIWPTLTAIAADQQPAADRHPQRHPGYVRWSAMAGGLPRGRRLLNEPDGGVSDLDALRREFWRETPEARREALMPFLWTFVARRGQLFGNAAKASPAQVANGIKFSYPGYNELFTGSPDPRIDSNDKRPNPNVTVFEWLNRRPTIPGGVRAVGSWDRYPYILNGERSGLSIVAGCVPFDSPSAAECQVLLNRL